jgi:putative ABC transport system ATP-binding protein
MGVIELKNVEKVYQIGGNPYQALKGVDLTVEKGEFLSIMGPSGSGKSTMLHILGCLDLPTSGKYLLDGKDVTRLSDNQLSEIRNQKLGFIFQSFNLLAKISVLDNVMLPFTYSQIPRSQWNDRAMEALRMVGLEDKAQNKPNQLSGGQVQRVAVARSFVMDPKVIFADEPTGNLDTKTSYQILDLIVEVHKNGGTIVLITHEPDIAKFASRTVFIRDGIIEDSNYKV